MIPAALLVCIAGFECAASGRGRRAIFVAIWAVILVVAASHHGTLPQAQALVRAATVPLAIAGFAILLGGLQAPRPTLRQLAMAGGIPLLAMHALYAASNQATQAGVLFIAAIGCSALLAKTPGIFDDSGVAIAVIALVVGHFLFVYVDYGALHRVAFVPASAVVLGARLTLSALAVYTVVAAAAAADRAAAIVAPGSTAPTNQGRTAVFAAALLAVMVVLAQLAYFFIDVFTDYRLRFVHATIVLLLAVAASRLLRSDAPARVTLPRISAAGLVGIAVIQFAFFYSDFLTGFQRRRSSERDGIDRIAFEEVIHRARDRSVPAVYLGWPEALANRYWQFYLVKHDREDLMPRTIPALTFDAERIRALPGGSIVVTKPSRDVDAAIERLAGQGELAKRDALSAPDGTRVFWILETSATQRF
jgi:hypothetical protein